MCQHQRHEESVAGSGSAEAKSFPFGVYVHFPFCLDKCGYCDFASLACRPERIPHRRYAQAVLRELGLRGAAYASGELRSVYFGGGTPSLWRSAELRRVLDAVRAHFRPAADIEVTVEVNPATLGAEGFEQLLDAGVGRVSLGVQSLDDEMLRLLGRIHDVAAARRAVRDARAAGVQNLSLDLMAGLPGQSLAHHLRQLDELLELAPEHVSVYGLSLSRQAPLGRAGFAPAPAELQADMLEAGAEALERRGLAQYEVSNFAPSERRSRHNGLVWAGWPYLGLGASAHSMWPEGSSTLRQANPALAGYLRQAAPTVERVEEPTSRHEVLFLGLRTVDGVQRASYRRRFGADLLDHFGPGLRVLEEGGWITVRPERVAPTRRGLWLADELVLRLMT